MNPKEILSLPIRDRRKIIDDLDDRLGFLKGLKQKNYALPRDLEILYEILEEERIRELPEDERLELFNQSKIKWCAEYPDFRKISELMEKFETNELLREYSSKSPPESIQNRAVEIYKKCLSFKVKLTNRQIKSLVYHNTPGPYCINPLVVKSFVNAYQEWNRKIYERWNDLYYLREDFLRNVGYSSNWKFYIQHPTVLAEKVTYVEKDINAIIDLLNSGIDLIDHYDKIVMEEYAKNSFEMSLYERELEISIMVGLENENDEQYCYVYTLECELFVFYVGIASNPKERFEQHIRGAFSNESHLFKSKFIQKYHNQIKQNIVYEGIRRDCKLFEKEYITEHNPLGNMTEGGEG